MALVDGIIVVDLVILLFEEMHFSQGIEGEGDGKQETGFRDCTVDGCFGFGF